MWANSAFISGKRKFILVEQKFTPKEKVFILTVLSDLLDSQEEMVVYLGLVDIMFAYVYNHRTTEGENHVSIEGTQSG